MKRTNRSRAPARRPSTQRRPVSTGSGMGAKLLIMAAVVAAVVVTSVIVLVGTTGRLFVGGTIVPARLLVGGAAPAGVIERHMRCSSQQCLSLNGVSAGLRRTLLKTPELNLSF